MQGVITSFDGADGIGRIELDDGRTVGFGLGAFQGFGRQRPVGGLAVRVTEVAEGIGGRLRAKRIEPAPRAPSSWDALRSTVKPALVRSVDDAVAIACPFDDLIAVLVDDGGYPATDAFAQHVTAPQLAGWSVEEEEVAAVARHNLGALPPWTVRTLESGTYELSSDDVYCAARLLRDDAVEGLWTSGLPVVFVPHRDRVLLTGTDDLAGIEIAYRLAGAYLERGVGGGVQYRVVRADGTFEDDEAFEPGALSGRAWVHTSGRWFPFVAPSGHPHAEGLAELARRSEGMNR